MSLSWNAIVEQIQQLQLMRSADVKYLSKLKSISKSPVKCLVKLTHEKMLTKYQARHLLEGKGARLRLGNYVILGPLGKGAMGRVLKARHTQMDRVVAIKMIHKEMASRATLAKRFSNEIQFVSKLSHPNIVQAYDAGVEDGVPYLVYEYVEGIDLHRLISKTGVLDPQSALRYMTQTACALAYAHSNSIIHRDVKPANLMINSDRNIKLLDLGLAKLCHEDDEDNEISDMSLTAEHSIVGSCAYMAPELAKSPKSYGMVTDIYSLGCTFYYLLHGKVPYSGKTYMETFIAHAQQKIPKLIEPNKFLSMEMNVLFEKMVAKNPKNRLQNMAEVAAELKKVEELYKEHDSNSAGYVRVDTATIEVAKEPSDSQWMPEESEPWYAKKSNLVSIAVIAVGVLVGAFLLIPKAKEEPKQPPNFTQTYQTNSSTEAPNRTIPATNPGNPNKPPATRKIDGGGSKVIPVAE